MIAKCYLNSTHSSTCATTTHHYLVSTINQSINQLLHSAEGVQQGDPLGPMLFCMSTMKLAKKYGVIGISGI